MNILSQVSTSLQNRALSLKEPFLAFVEYGFAPIGTKVISLLSKGNLQLPTLSVTVTNAAIAGIFAVIMLNTLAHYAGKAALYITHKTDALANVQGESPQTIAMRIAAIALAILPLSAPIISVCFPLHAYYFKR